MSADPAQDFPAPLFVERKTSTRAAKCHQCGDLLQLGKKRVGTTITRFGALRSSPVWFHSGCVGMQVDETAGRGPTSCKASGAKFTKGDFRCTISDGDKGVVKFGLGMAAAVQFLPVVLQASSGRGVRGEKMWSVVAQDRIKGLDALSAPMRQEFATGLAKELGVQM